LSEQRKDRIDLFIFLRAFCLWGICALALLICAAVLYAAEGTNLSSMGYASSVISFLSAVAAGTAVRREKGKSTILLGLTVGAFLTGLLLLIGFMIAGKLNGSAVLSTVSFTVAGCLLGAILPFGRMRKKKRFRRK